LDVGTIAQIWRYPVKSMLGEQLRVAICDENGIVGDRRFALFDPIMQKQLTARKLSSLLQHSASAFDDEASEVVITLPDGQSAFISDEGISETLSATLKTKVIVRDSSEPGGSTGGFKDDAPVHLVTTATLKAFGAIYPEGQFDQRRFRPNILIDTGVQTGFLEDAWIGKTLRLGDWLKLEIIKPCARCVMTTLAQSELPADSGILKTIANNNDDNLGVYARVLAAGAIRQGDKVWLE
jgi:uncharacterized protein YcbX